MKVPAAPPVGHVIAYEYLWKSQADTREDGRAAYPAAVVLARDDLGPAPVAYVLGISHSPPSAEQRALQLPAKLKRFLGLDDEPSWIYTDEVNVFVWPGPDLRAAELLSTRAAAVDTCVIGPLPTDWFDEVKNHLAESYRLAKVRSIKRTA